MATDANALPPGFTIRTGGGSTFLEVDLSHFDLEAVREMAWQMAKTRGYSEKPRRTAWKGKRTRRHSHTGRNDNRRPEPISGHSAQV